MIIQQINMRQLCDVWNCMQLNKENSKKKRKISNFDSTSFHHCARCIILHASTIHHLHQKYKAVELQSVTRFEIITTSYIAHLHRNFNLITRESRARAAAIQATVHMTLFFLFFCLASSVSFSVFFSFFPSSPFRFVRSNLFHGDNFALWIIKLIAIRLGRCTSASSPRSRSLRSFFRSGDIFRKLIGI